MDATRWRLLDGDDDLGDIEVIDLSTPGREMLLYVDPSAPDRPWPGVEDRVPEEGVAESEAVDPELRDRLRDLVDEILEAGSV